LIIEDTNVDRTDIQTLLRNTSSHQHITIIPQERLDGIFLRRLLHAVAATLPDEALDA